MLVPALLTLVGVVLLVFSADRVVADGSRLAARFGISPLVVGLTVVSIGTSLPELAIGLSDVRRGGGGLAVGNIVGTNLVNQLLVLGIAALLAPIVLQSRVLRLDLPAMLGATLLLLVLVLDGGLSTLDGGVLLAYAAGYFALVAVVARRESKAGGPQDEGGAEAAAEPPTDAPGRTTLTLLVAMAVLVGGAELLVRGASDLARQLGASEALVGLTVVAIGTSLPELVTAVVATYRGGRALALGNVIGSSVLNIALVLGLTSVVAGTTIPVPDEIIYSDVALLVASTLLCIPVFVTGRRISRVEGGVFVAAYVAYLVWLLSTRL